MRRCYARLTTCAALAMVAAAWPAAWAADWPTFLGDGDRTPPVEGMRLVDSLDDAPVLWELDRHLSVGKGLYPGTLKAARGMGIEPFYGGASSPIVADGTLYVSCFRPNGRTPAAVEPWRTVSDPQQHLPPWFFSVTADDILLAVDALTGKVRWERVEKNKGHNRLGHKRGHWCASPACADGRVFSMGTAGLLYAYDAASGKKLWEAVAEPGLQRQRDEYLKSKKLCWKAGEKSSLIVVEGAVIAPHVGLTAFEADSGKPRWSIDDRILSQHATPAVWRHQGRRYLVVNSGRGELRLIDPRDGRVLWTEEGLGEQLGSVNVTGDLAALNAGSAAAADEKRNGLFGVYRLSLAGLRRLWTLPDRPEYRHSWTMDRGAERRVAIHDGKAYLVVGAEEDRLVVADAEKGRILFEQAVPRAHAPYPIEDRLLLYYDRAHTDPVTAAWWSIGDAPRPLHGKAAFAPRTITAYETPIEWPYVDGLLYLRTLRGLACLDLRKPAAGPRNQTLRMTIPGRLAGVRDDLRITLTQRDGKLTHGGFAGAATLHAVDVSRAQWDGRRLRGALGIDVNGYRHFGEFAVDAALGKGGGMTGTVAKRVAGFQKPIALRGAISAMPRQANWMPDCDYVLQLDEAAIQEGGRQGRLLLFLTAANGRLDRVEGFADKTTQAKPIVDASELTLQGDRLKGTLRVCYRADEWTRPQVEKGDTAAAEYKIDAQLLDSGPAGSFQGSWGAPWSQTAALVSP